MKKLELIEDLDTIQGKTISDTYRDGRYLWVKFSDGSFIRLYARDIMEGFEHTKTVISACTYDLDGTEDALLKLGILTQEEYDEACKEAEIAAEKRRREYEEEQKRQTEEYERNQLRKLREKYGA